MGIEDVSTFDGLLRAPGISTTPPAFNSSGRPEAAYAHSIALIDWI